MYLDIDLTENELYQMIDQFNERKSIATRYSLIFLNKIHSFYNGNGRMCEIFLANDAKSNKANILKKDNIKRILILLNV